MQNLSLVHQVLDRSRNVFDRHFRIDAMLIEKIYAVGPQPFERSLNDLLDVIWFAVKSGKPTSCLLIYVPTKLGSDPDLVSKWLDRLAEDAFVFEWPVSFWFDFDVGCRTNDKTILMAREELMLENREEFHYADQHICLS
jgi:hypothetical protein